MRRTIWLNEKGKKKGSGEYVKKVDKRKEILERKYE